MNSVEERLAELRAYKEKRQEELAKIKAQKDIAKEKIEVALAGLSELGFASLEAAKSKLNSLDEEIAAKLESIEEKLDGS